MKKNKNEYIVIFYRYEQSTDNIYCYLGAKIMEEKQLKEYIKKHGTSNIENIFIGKKANVKQIVEITEGK